MNTTADTVWYVAEGEGAEGADRKWTEMRPWIQNLTLIFFFSILKKISDEGQDSWKYFSEAKFAAHVLHTATQRQKNV